MSGLDDPVRAPSLAFTIEQHGRRLLAALRTTMIGRVVRYDAAQQLVDVQPLVKDWYFDEEGTRVVESVPVIANVPVQFMTAGGFTFTVPIVADPESGTTGTIWFAERSLDRWLTGTGGEVDPEVYLRHALADGIFMPGVLPFGAPMSVAPPTDHATAGSVTGQRIHFRDSEIVIGDEADALPIVRDEDTVNAGTVTGTAPPGGGPVTFTYTPAGGVPGAPSTTLALTGGKVAASATVGKTK